MAVECFLEVKLDSLYDLFKGCLEANYIHIDDSADYAIEEKGNTLYIYLQCSRGVEDWINNFDFLPVTYKNLDGKALRCHKGFLRVFKAIEPMINPVLSSSTKERVVISGYSHGGAVAALCYEYVISIRPDLSENYFGYGFGAPRILYGRRSIVVADRWKNFVTVRNRDDIVTHLPPRAFGYFHPGKIIEIGCRGKYTRFDAHRPENILAELRELS